MANESGYRAVFMMWHLTYQSTVIFGNLFGVCLDEAQINSLTIGQLVQRLLSNVEPFSSMVDGQNVNAPALVGQLPAGAAVGRVPAGNGLCTADVGECGKVTKGVEALGEEAIFTI